MRLSQTTPYICRNCAHLIKPSFLHSISSRTRNGFRRKFSAAAPTARPFRLAVIGSGPAGFYAASRVLREHSKTVVDMYERLPVPFGLVRYGVAPDHPEVKNCQDRFEEVASLPNFNFIGNIKVGEDVPLSLLALHYDAILFAYGASMDRELGIPGEQLHGVYSARSFVAWYNGLPGASDLNPALTDGENAVVIGQGNVALDVARILLTNLDDLRKTDMPEYALARLSKSKIKRVHIVGRRGPMQAAFTIKEARELTHIQRTSFHPIAPQYFPEDLKSLPRPRRRLAELMIKSGTTDILEKHCSLDFLLSPTAFVGTNDNLAGINFEKNEYTDEAKRFEPTAGVQPILHSQPVLLPATVAFRSIGYKSEPLPGMNDLGVPFDIRKGIISNVQGRVETSSATENAQLQSVYVAGWAKRGPTGVIASTMEDAFATADCILEDIRTVEHLSSRSTGQGWDTVKKTVLMNGFRPVSWKDWKRIDEAEKMNGQKLGKEREKFSDVSQMLQVI
jgi:adrenodoxin-NADP+ reductase